MVGSFFRLAAAAAFCALLAGCAGAPSDMAYNDAPRARDTSRDSATMTIPEKPLSCVPFARDHSGVDIHGDAYTWWEKADGHYRKSTAPSDGAVMVLVGYAGPNHAHVAVVRRIVSAREIRIDHANWLNNGAIFLDDPVADISPNNDWSQVLVWNVQTHAWGVHTYNVQGFIGPGGAARTDRVASLDSE
jgi:hypothetical protein